MPKFIPIWLYRLLVVGLFVCILTITALWGSSDQGLYRLIHQVLRDADLFSTIDGDLIIGAAALLFTFFLLLMGCLPIMLLLRECTPGMAGIRDEIAYLKGEPVPTPFDDPASQAMLRAGIGLIMAVVLLVINLILLLDTGQVWLWLALAVPVSLGLAIYAFIEAYSHPPPPDA